MLKYAQINIFLERTVCNFLYDITRPSASQIIHKIFAYIQYKRTMNNVKKNESLLDTKILEIKVKSAVHSLI